VERVVLELVVGVLVLMRRLFPESGVNAALLLADRERSKTHVIVAREREPLLRGCFILMVVVEFMEAAMFNVEPV
jgi:hypothetical protein